MNKPRVEYKYINWVLYIKCIKCSEYKEANSENFNKDKTLTFWLSHKCKDCKKIYNIWYYKENKDTLKEKNKTRRGKNIWKIKEQKERYYKENKDKIDDRIKSYRWWYNKKLWYNRAYFHTKTNNYIKKHNLRPSVCTIICWYKWKIFVHHPSYDSLDKWCEIVFCCQSCHKNIHSWNIECPKPINLLDL
jgi:hypothetical protein